MDYGITYSTGDYIYGYSDVDWAQCIDDRKSIYSYCFIYGGELISWSSKKQSSVSSSSTEPEYKAYYFATCETLWLIQLMRDLLNPLHQSITIFTNSQSAIALAKYPIYHTKAKHIDIAYHFRREQVNLGIMRLEYCQSKDNLAVILPKHYMVNNY